MKELLIQIRVEGKQIATVVKKTGFDDSASSTAEIVGLLQNLLATEQGKLRVVMTAQAPDGTEV